MSDPKTNEPGHGAHEHQHPHASPEEQPHSAHSAHAGHDHPHEAEPAPERLQAESSAHAHPHAEDSHEHGTAAHEQPHPAGHNHAEETHDDPHAVNAHGHANGDHGHDHDEKTGGVLGFLRRLGLLHGHSHAVNTDEALESNEKGIRAVKISLVVLGATASFQVAVVLVSGSVALLADTIHNFTDAMTALPLWLAFALARRPASRRFTHGFGRTEDLAGLLIVLIILGSAVVAGYESYRKILHPTPLSNVEWVIAAAIIGFIGNEAVAMLRIRVGKEIGSAALVVDGQHARVDGLTSLAVLVGAIGVLAGAPLADPIIGALITVAILFITKDAALMVYHRLMDAVDPALVLLLEDSAAEVINAESGARSINAVRLRWLGHRLQAELNLVVDDQLSTKESHRIAEELRHALFHALPGLASVVVHVDPWSADGLNHHDLTDHHGTSKRAAGPQLR